MAEAIEANWDMSVKDPTLLMQLSRWMSYLKKKSQSDYERKNCCLGQWFILCGAVNIFYDVKLNI